MTVTHNWQFEFILYILQFFIIKTSMCRLRTAIWSPWRAGRGPRRNRASTHKMELNPIYESVLYETTPGESFKLLNDPSESRISRATIKWLATSRYARASPNLPPPRTQLIDSCCEFDTSGKIKSLTMKPDDQNQQCDNDRWKGVHVVFRSLWNLQ